VAVVATAGVVAGAAALPASAQGTAPAIDVWYGDVQHVGATGHTQRWANVLGRVTDPNGDVTSLTWSLNGGPERPLTIGDDHPRLLQPGDFNVEIDRDDLVAGENEVVITATDRAGNEAQRTVTLVHHPGATWPLPTRVEWAGATRPTDVVDVVDGRWSVTPDGVRNDVSGYDRLLAVGDVTWTDYEIEVPVTVHSLYANDGAVGFFLRWTGHTEAPPHQPGMQPRAGWRPSGALAWYRGLYGHPPRVEISSADEDVLAADQSGFSLTPGRTYVFRASVQRTAQGDRYRMTVVPAGQPESAGVTIEALDTTFAKANGSALLIAHRAQVTFGDVVVTEVGGEAPPPPPNRPPIVVDDVAATAVGTPVVIDVLANDSDPDGALVPSSVTVVAGPEHGSTTVDPATGAVTYAPEDGFTGEDVFAYTVADDDGAVAGPATVTVSVDDDPEPPPSGGGLVSDEFSSPSLGSWWSWFDPVGDGSVVATGSHVELSVPAGVSHDLWTGALRAPRLLQAVEDTDFTVEVKVDSAVSSAYQMQGLVVQEGAQDLIRFEVHHDGGSPRFFVATIDGGSASARANRAAPAGAPYWLRVVREGDVWTLSGSGDGVSWTQVASFSFDLSVAQVGLFVGNHTPSPAHTARFDHFRVS
jgi:regulation of enolase protein 1 (concanavalin A-like superfamily)